MIPARMDKPPAVPHAGKALQPQGLFPFPPRVVPIPGAPSFPLYFPPRYGKIPPGKSRRKKDTENTPVSERITQPGPDGPREAPAEEEEGEAFPLLTRDDFYDLLMEQQEQM